MNKSRFFLLLGLTIAASASIFTTPIDAAGPTANDLVAAVNAYRVANGYYAMNPHPLVYQAAQTHAEWIVATGQGGHIGAGGSDETMRVSWTGYGGGATIQCDENWSSGATIDDAVYGAWSDWVHQEVMLNQWGNRYTDIGGGVAAWGEGRYVFILNVCKIVGQEASGDVPVPPGGNGPAAVPPTPDYSNFIYGVTTATPQFDGTVIHVVRYGQSLLSIAQAYGITIEELRALNGFAPDFVAIWPDDELIIKQGTGETAPAPSPTVEAEQATPTATVRPTYTPSSMEMTATAEAAGKVEETADSVTKPTLTAGLVLLLSAGLALVILVYFSGGRNE